MEQPKLLSYFTQFFPLITSLFVLLYAMLLLNIIVYYKQTVDKLGNLGLEGTVRLPAYVVKGLLEMGLGLCRRLSCGQMLI